jgi:hypothetical protein
MAQATAASTDDLLSQLASSEIDRLLAEADGNPAPAPKKAAQKPSPDANAEPITNGPERAALLQAAGFDTPDSPPTPPAASAPAETPAPVADERTALLQAAGFESPGKTDTAVAGTIEIEQTPQPYREPIYIKPLVWINAPLASKPEVVRQVLGKVSIVTLLNALAVLAYVIFFKKH